MEALINIVRPLVLGSDSSLGIQLDICLQKKGVVRKAIKAGDIIALSNSEVRGQLQSLIRGYAPTHIINILNKQSPSNEAESIQVCSRINSDLCGVIGEVASTFNLPIISVSSYRVFNGSRPADTAYLETDPPDPYDEYGCQKLKGEFLLKGSGAKGVVVRPGILYTDFASLSTRIYESKSTAINGQSLLTLNPTKMGWFCSRILDLCLETNSTSSLPSEVSIRHIASKGGVSIDELSDLISKLSSISQVKDLPTTFSAMDHLSREIGRDAINFKISSLHDKGALVTEQEHWSTQLLESYRYFLSYQ